MFNPAYLLQIYKKEKEAAVRDYLHIIFHCIYRHMFVSSSINRTCWDLACDISVENIISELGLAITKSEKQRWQTSVLSEIKNDVPNITAEKVYRYLLDKKMSVNELKSIHKDFIADDHFLWYSSSLNGQRSNKNGNEDNISNSSFGDMKSMEQNWKNISERVQQELKIFYKMQGDRAGSMIRNLDSVNREKYDYTAFLRKFAVMCEAMKVNDDEFDYIYYTYGLKLYDKMPLIEPLEYKEVKLIKEFVIAIDTSGSTEGELVETFVKKTYNILKSMESFSKKINLHIIQCDADVQEHVKITSQKEFDAYIGSMRVLGLGGTDFRPVFELVDALIDKKEFENLKGLIYFTDGYGTFPKKKPDYETAFVFVEDDGFNVEVPSWAIKLVLPSYDIAHVNGEDDYEY
jgi:predicted metal-dependent peptidase